MLQQSISHMHRASLNAHTRQAHHKHSVSVICAHISWRLAQRGHYTQRQNSPREHEGEESTELTTMIVQTTVDVTAGEDHLYLLYTGTK